MPKYRAFIQTFAGDHQGLVGGETVLEADKTPVKTGLLDASGTPIYRLSESVTLGFDIRKSVTG